MIKRNSSSRLFPPPLISLDPIGSTPPSSSTRRRSPRRSRRTTAFSAQEAGVSLSPRSSGSRVWNLAGSRSRSPSPSRPITSSRGRQGGTLGSTLSLNWSRGASALNSEGGSSKGRRGILRPLAMAVPWRKVAVGMGIGLCLLAGTYKVRSLRDRTSDTKAGKGQQGRKWSLRRGGGGRDYAGEVLSSSESPYCSAPLDYPAVENLRKMPPAGEGGGGREGDGRGGAWEEELELKQLQVTIRHGDRSAINVIPNAHQRYWHCLPFSEGVRETWEGVRRYDIENIDGRTLERSLIPSTLSLERISDEAVKKEAGHMCGTGQLTEKGIQQHLALGASFRNAYLDLFGGELDPKEVYIRSTDYTRTLQSAAAFLLSFLPKAERLTMVTDEDESGEVMHGVGLRSSSKVEGGGERPIAGTCQRAVDLNKDQNMTFHTRSDVLKELVSLFGEGVLDMKITEVADAVHSLSCHDMVLPCSDKGCMSPSLALSVMAEGDRRMCMRYMGAAGGMESAALAIFPFTNEILSNMKAALSGSSDVRFALYSGHDTVVAPVLASLGAFNCRWPPYASHVAFELWGPKQVKGEAVEGRDGAGEDTSTPGEGGGRGRQIGEGDEGFRDGGMEEAFVRVTFNGKDVTQLVTDCRSEEGPFGKGFCPLSVFSKTIGRAIAPHATLEEACDALVGHA